MKKLNLKISDRKLKEFEEKVSGLWEDGELPFLLHLSGGNEAELIKFFDSNIREGDWIFSTHRNHYHALLAGIDENKLMNDILFGKSMFIFDKSRNFLTSSILAGTCPIAAGVAYGLKEAGSKNKVWCFLGDGAEEQGGFYEAVMMVAGHDLPCKFIIEDNDRSVDSTIEERLPNKVRLSWPECVYRYKYAPVFPHAGNGTKKHITFKNPERWAQDDTL